MIQGFTVRRALPFDAPKVIAVIDAVGAEGIWLATDRYVPTPQWEQVLHHPDAEPRALLLVAETQKKIVGWCRVFPYKFGDKSLHVADIGIGVHRDSRRLGIGSALLSDAISLARSQGFEKLTLDLYSSSEIARHLFERVGFQIVGIRSRHAKINGTYVNEILMEMKL